MKNGICETTADCLRELARVVDMFEGTGLSWRNGICEGLYPNWPSHEYPRFLTPCDWKFARAIVEGKPVFVGDTMYDKTGAEFKVRFLPDLGGRIVLSMFDHVAGIRYADECSWSKPKAKEKLSMPATDEEARAGCIIISIPFKTLSDATMFRLAIKRAINGQ